MKTSLNTLRATNACTGGYGRQASFWTVRPAAKAIEYPIWMIGLTGSYDDLNWAIENSLIVDEEDFKELKARTFWPMFQSVFWRHIHADHILEASKKKKGDFHREALQEALAIRDAEQAQAWMDKYARFKLATTLFSHVANNPIWRDPQKYLAQLTHAVIQERSEMAVQHAHLPFDLDKHVPGHDSRTGSSYRKKAATPSRVRRVADEEEDKSKGFYFDLPEDKGRVVTKGEKFAYVCLNRDPWPVALQFLMDNNVPQIVGSKMMLSKVSEDGKQPEQFHASLNLSDPRMIFQLMHLLQGQDFDLLKAMHVEQKLNRLSRSLERDCDDNMDNLDQVIDNVDNDWTNTQRNIISEQRSAVADLEEAGPTGGAIRERQINRTSSGDEEIRPVARNSDEEYEEDDEDESAY